MPTATCYDHDPRVESVADDAYIVTTVDDEAIPLVFEVIHTRRQGWTIRLADMPGRPLLDIGGDPAVNIPTAEQAIALLLGGARS